MSDERFRDDDGKLDLGKIERYEDSSYKIVLLLKYIEEQQSTINKLREILAEAEDMIEVRLAEHYIKEYENIKHHIIGDNDG